MELWYFAFRHDHDPLPALRGRRHNYIPSEDPFTKAHSTIVAGGDSGCLGAV